MAASFGLRTWTGGLVLDPAKPVVVCCVHGLDVGRSTALSLRARGFDARYLAGGIAAGLPITTVNIAKLEPGVQPDPKLFEIEVPKRRLKDE